jgi:CubicO group peptidase (beta-lactamase class C family)
MDSAKYGDAKAIIKNRNPMIYTFQNGPFENWNFDYGLAQTTAAGLNMSIVDLGKFFSNIEELVPDSNTWSLLGDGYKLNENLSSHYGLGWTVRNINGKIYFGHEGGGCCWVEYCPKDKAYYIILTNLTGARADEMIVKLIESLSD